MHRVLVKDQVPGHLQRASSSSSSSKVACDGSCCTVQHPRVGKNRWATYWIGNKVRKRREGRKASGRRVSAAATEASSSLPKGGSVHQVCVEYEGGAPGSRQQQQLGCLRWVVLYSAVPKGGKGQVSDTERGLPFAPTEQCMASLHRHNQ